ncbi:GrrA/OscA1 family cyclophane-containing rSAM-modified RiPP [Geminocystis sp. NIES-3709]|uniref:GrrA/OscA1 family cyclophane-containing rSAM-modified RiPP n=1 Tax=Geminocystis sp. NIES-3709 TaxID=1617448 RepID=UPI0005FCB712|nr:GrrA/OscA1 family cyclophane-containing rSAM-modified RiPP [Geminocystis sp. NIES-3709]BAQ66838.1 hypothetical protein GM3709_3603 [Geminocystis sp. NIES-3709]
MNIKNLTWLGFFLTLSSLTIASKTIAINPNNNSGEELNTIETRLNRIFEVLKINEQNLLESAENHPHKEISLRGFANGGGGFANRVGPGGFLNDNGGGGFLNNRGWGDGGGGFLNRR